MLLGSVSYCLVVTLILVLVVIPILQYNVQTVEGTRRSLKVSSNSCFYSQPYNLAVMDSPFANTKRSSRLIGDGRKLQPCLSATVFRGGR